mmetsp:Transcript_10373/g.30329  ORF Transcript_10373/g.30329 Transcript_10373/m.30329 type:complete len:95 (-) Transcript_10373:440-724(-)
MISFVSLEAHGNYAIPVIEKHKIQLSVSSTGLKLRRQRFVAQRGLDTRTSKLLGDAFQDIRKILIRKFPLYQIAREIHRYILNNDIGYIPPETW